MYVPAAIVECFFRLGVDVLVHFGCCAMDEQMDRTWVHRKLFSPEYIAGVKEFMSFVHRKFSENVEILCPCGRCLNQKYMN